MTQTSEVDGANADYVLAAQISGISEKTLRRGVAAGKLPHTRPSPRVVRFTRAQLEEIVRLYEVRPDGTQAINDELPRPVGRRRKAG
ncbi:MAG: helix-turn-helix domain-containing protein [Chloroflexi bacterium]|nr:helix-turn-helix domain-containing protein [Chloroflexota bacterium]